MARTLHLLGVVLAKENWRENDRIISFYSQESGKVEILVRGARKINSKLAPVLSEPFALLRLVVVPGKNFAHLIGGEVKEHFKKILKDKEKVIRVNTLFKQVNKLVKPQKSDSKIFSLIVKFLEKICQLPREKIQIVNNAFLIKFLAFLGYRPEIKHCLVCRQIPQKKELTFNLDKGGIVCSRHNLEDNQNNQIIKINQKVLEVLQKLLYKDFDSLIKQNFVQKDFLTAQKVIKKFFNWHLN